MKSHVARLLLAFVPLLTVTGCLIEDPPDLREAKQTPPRLDLRLASPAIDRILNITEDLEKNGVPFTVPVSSEDAGDKINGFLFVDYEGTPQDRAQAFGVLAPSTLDDLNRDPLSFTWSPQSLTQGCHQLTLLVSHRDNFNFQFPISRADVAVAVWWINVRPLPDAPSTLFNCPTFREGP